MGKVKRPRPARVVSVSSVVTPEASVTVYEPMAVFSSLCANCAVVSDRLPDSAPETGRIGTSPATSQPGPETWVRLKPESFVLSYS